MTVQNEVPYLKYQYPTDGFVGVDTDILSKATALVPLLRKNSEQADRDGVIPDENIAALSEAGLWGLTRPSARGGYQTNVRTTVEVIREIASGCGSTAWAMMISTVEQFVVCFLNGNAQDDIYSVSTNPRFCGTFAPTSKTRRVDGGIIVSGRWGWSSNSEHADWAFMGIPIPDENGGIAGYGQALLPMSKCRIERTWDAAGLRASSSHHVSAEEVFVPNYMVLDIMAAAQGNRTSAYEGSLYQSAFTASLNLMTASPMPGLAQHALDSAIKNVGEKPVTYTTYTKGKDAPTIQIGIARASSKIDTALMHMRAAADGIDSAVTSGKELSVEDFARVRMATGVMGEESRDAVDFVLDASGAGVFLRSNQIQRAWRDLSVASRHGYLLNTTNAQIYGAHLLGGTQIAPLL
ncbi:MULTISPECIES: acyl-CoA dehydrogenase family protein [Caballeronia]|uniref:acyl-CoA dehydrogenase family protein n=1 Tax=Caballeronia TaxID=1827195 RepID=UPI001FD29AAC|nr:MULTISPECIES: acyl-CoA dehydrogenase family protein [Caballeronia]MDR5799108.1 acyl-CoA dehydrogenase family protein [Caballeronia sp. LZ001]